MRETKKYKIMTLNQRLFMETVQRLGRSTIGQVANEVNVSRESLMKTAKSLLEQGYLKRTNSTVINGNGRTPSIYELSGAPFPPSSELLEKLSVRTGRQMRTVQTMLEAGQRDQSIALLVTHVNAMVLMGSENR